MADLPLGEEGLEEDAIGREVGDPFERFEEEDQLKGSGEQDPFGDLEEGQSGQREAGDPSGFEEEDQSGRREAGGPSDSGEEDPSGRRAISPGLRQCFQGTCAGPRDSSEETGEEVWRSHPWNQEPSGLYGGPSFDRNLHPLEEEPYL